MINPKNAPFLILPPPARTRLFLDSFPFRRPKRVAFRKLASHTYRSTREPTPTALEGRGTLSTRERPRLPASIVCDASCVLRRSPRKQYFRAVKSIAGIIRDASLDHLRNLRITSSCGGVGASRGYRSLSLRAEESAPSLFLLKEISPQMQAVQNGKFLNPNRAVQISEELEGPAKNFYNDEDWESP